ncbi:zinc knuckle CX2CX4HX4C containing protein [Tanacetum coccineum]
MRSKRTIKPTQIFDNSVYTTTTKTKNKQKTGTKKNSKNEGTMNETVVDNRVSDDEMNSEIRGNGASESIGGVGSLEEDEVEVLEDCYSNGDEMQKESNWEEMNMPVEIDEQGNEFVLFDETIISEGCRFGFKDIVDVNNGIYFIKFHNTEGLEAIVESGPWMVNSKPFFVQKWDIHVCLDKKEPEMIPIWVRLCNVPLEAWTTKGISALASRLGKPLVMDNVTAEMCKMGVGRVRYARVLVEVSAKKVLPQEFKIVYRDKGNEEICRKVIHVKYDRKPTRCSECCVFGHNVDNCVKNKPNKEKDVTVSEPVQDKPNGNVDTNDNGGYTEVIYRKKNGIGNKSKNNN